MQAYNEAKIKVGCFATLALTVFVGFLFWIAGGDAGALFGRSRDVYVVPFTDVTGLRSSAEGKLAGKTIGEVVGTRLRDNGVADVVMEIDRSVPIYANAIFTLVRPTLIGTAYIQIDPGKPDTRGGQLISAVVGEPEEVAQAKAQKRMSFDIDRSVAGSGLEAIMAKVDDALTTFVQHEDLMLTRINDLLASSNAIIQRADSVVQRADESLRDGQLEEITSNTAALTAEIRKMVEENRTQVNDLISSINRTVDSADAQLVARSEDFGSLVRSVQKNMDEQITPLLVSLEKLTTGIDGMMVDNSQNLAATMRSMRATMENLEAFTARIKANPSLLIFGDDEKKAERLAAQERLNRDVRDMGRLPIYDKRE